MRIGLLCSTPMPPQEGISTYVWQLARQLRAHGHEPIVLTRGRGLHVQRAHEAGADVLRLPYLPLHPAHVRLQERMLRKAWPSLGLDLVHAHTPYPPRPPATLPLVVTVHTPMAADAARIRERTFAARLQRAQSAVVTGHERALLEQADIVTAVSAHVAEDLPQLGFVGPVRVLGNAIDATEFAPMPERNGGPQSGFVLYAGRLGFRKGLPALLEAFAALPAKDTRLLLTGRGELRPALERQAAQLGLDGRVRFLGVVDRAELLCLYAEADAVAIPSDYEGQPTVLLEAMAAGAPVVATAIPGVTDVAEHRRTALLVPPGQPAPLAAALGELLDEPAKARALGRAARARVLATHTWQARAKDYIGVYEEALARHG